MTPVAIALVASLCWGTTDFLSGLAGRRVGVPVTLLIVQGVGLVLAFTAALVFAEAVPDLGTLARAAGAGISGAAGLGLFFTALTLGRMSVVAPISACSAILPAVVGLAGGDRFSLLLAAGFVSAIAGIVLVSRERDDGEGGRAGARSVLLAILGAVGLGGYYVLFNGVGDESLAWGLVAARVIPVTVLAAIVAVHGRRPDRPARRLAVGAGVLDVSATALYGVALTLGSLSAVSVVGSLFPLTTVLLARVVLDERLRHVQQLGIAFALLGVALIASA